MFLEYLFQPIQNALYAVLAIQRMTPRIPFAVLAALTVGLDHGDDGSGNQVYRAHQ